MPINTENKPLITVSSASNVVARYDDSCVNWHFAPKSPLNVNVVTIGTITFPKGTQIPNSDYELQQYILAELHVTEDGYVIQCHSIDEEAYGHTFQEAYLDFLTSIRDRYLSLSKRGERLSTQESKVHQTLCALLVKSKTRPEI